MGNETAAQSLLKREEKVPNMLRKNNVHSDSMMTVTSETFSISGVDHPIITKMNSFHDQLADQLLTEKEFSFVQDVDDEDEDLNEDDVFAEASSPQEIDEIDSSQKAPNPESLAMDDFARVWARAFDAVSTASKYFTDSAS